MIFIKTDDPKTVWKIFAISCLILLIQVGYAQEKRDFRSIDKYAQKAPKAIEKKLPDLVAYLTKKATNDFEKVRSFYIWLVNNIDYDNTAIKFGSKRINHSNQEVLNRKKAICQGYSNLFYEMCRMAKIPSEVVIGYPKTPKTVDPDLNTVNHTWNAVLIEGKWYLLDPTWGAGNDQAFVEAYFLTPPEIFITDHLPNDPMWQLLHCPISAGDFKKKEENITAQVQKKDTCFHFRDSIQQYMALTRPEKKLKNALNGFKFNPVEENKKYLASMYMDMVSHLSDLSYEYEIKDSIEAVLGLQLEIIKICEKASELVELYDPQKENLAYTHFNYAVALSRQLPDLESKKDQTELIVCYKKMLHHFEKGKAILTEVPPNMLSENGLKQFDEYIDYVQSLLKKYE